MNSNTIILNGTPVHFINAAMAWWYSQERENFWMYEEFTHIETVINPPTGNLIDDLLRYETVRKHNPAYTQLIVTKQTEEAGGLTIERLVIDAREIGPNRTNATAWTDHWDTFSGIWEELRAALEDAGLIDQKPSEEAEPAEEAEPVIAPPGRPTHPEYDWAFEEIQKGRKPNDVWREFTEKYLPNVTDNDVADNELSSMRTAFDSAMRYRRGKLGK